jgi:hypothetical protein
MRPINKNEIEHDLGFGTPGNAVNACRNRLRAAICVFTYLALFRAEVQENGSCQISRDVAVTRHVWARC